VSPRWLTQSELVGRAVVECNKVVDVSLSTATRRCSSSMTRIVGRPLLIMLIPRTSTCPDSQL
jgi:hypothetical protein